jgi:hypothetical protein
MARAYIVQTYNIQEIFFKDFNAEYRAYKQIADWRFTVKEGSSTKSLDPYTQLIESIPKAESAVFKEKPESYIIQYYRLVRNGIVHKSDTSMNKPADYFAKHILPLADYFKDYYQFLPQGKLPAPNGPNELTHYDFVLQSRCLKYLVNLIVNACNLSVTEIFQFEITSDDFLATMTYYDLSSAGSRKKLRESLGNFFNFKYGKLKNEREEFINEYFRWKGIDL